MGSLPLLVLMMFSITMGLLCQNWLIVIFMMEFSMFCLIFLSSTTNNVSSGMWALKYFLVQSIGSVILMFAGLLVYFYQDISEWWLAIALLGLCLKLGVFPMHFWVLPVNKSLTFLQLGLVNSPLKILPLSLLSEVCGFFSQFNISHFLFLLAGGSMISGVVIGLSSVTLRGILGASSITHSGWFLLAAMSWDVFKYFFLYSISLLMFIFFVMGSWNMYSGLALYALAGLPPFSVFFGKLFVVKVSLILGYPMPIIVVALASSVFSLIYYLNFSFYLYMLKKNSGPFVLGVMFCLMNFLITFKLFV
uniref:NADH dehydrogenase subunit 2 n=1 Tax=Satsuma myomphala TaxID=358001 RepID=UPI0030031E56